LKKWWSWVVMEMLLLMHLAYTSEFSGGQQTAGWKDEKATAHKTKFETNQKNWLEDLAKKRGRLRKRSKLTEKKTKTVVEASAQLVLVSAMFNSTCSG